MRCAGDYRFIFVCLFWHIIAWLQMQELRVADILQFVCTQVFSQSAKAQCSADQRVFSSYAHAVVQMHPLGYLTSNVLLYVCIGEIFLEERLLGGEKWGWSDW